MSWECPYQQLKGRELLCDRVGNPCKPMQKGCILEQWRKATRPARPAKVRKPRAQ